MSFLSNSYQAPSMVPVTMCVDQFNSAWLANGESQQSFGALGPYLGALPPRLGYLYDFNPNSNRVSWVYKSNRDIVAPFWP